MQTDTAKLHTDAAVFALRKLNVGGEPVLARRQHSRRDERRNICQYRCVISNTVAWSTQTVFRESARDCVHGHSSLVRRNRRQPATLLSACISRTILVCALVGERPRMVRDGRGARRELWPFVAGALELDRACRAAIE